MRKITTLLGFFAFCCVFGAYGWSQATPAPTSTDAGTTAVKSPQKTARQKTSRKGKHPTGPGKEMGKGGEDVGVGAAKGTGDLAKGTAGAVGDLAHGSVGGAGASMGKGAGGFGKNVAVGSGKGIGKLGKGMGGEFEKIGKSKNHNDKVPQDNESASR